MRVAIFSDVHGNLPALDAVLSELERERFDAVYWLGDLVGYGASPDEVTERIRASGVPTILAITTTVLDLIATSADAPTGIALISNSATDRLRGPRRT